MSFITMPCDIQGSNLLFLDPTDCIMNFGFNLCIEICVLHVELLQREEELEEWFAICQCLVEGKPSAGSFAIKVDDERTISLLDILDRSRAIVSITIFKQPETLQQRVGTTIGSPTFRRVTTRRKTRLKSGN